MILGRNWSYLGTVLNLHYICILKYVFRILRCNLYVVQPTNQVYGAACLRMYFVCHSMQEAYENGWMVFQVHRSLLFLWKLCDQIFSGCVPYSIWVRQMPSCLETATFDWSSCSTPCYSEIKCTFLQRKNIENCFLHLKKFIHINNYI